MSGNKIENITISSTVVLFDSKMSQNAYYEEQKSNCYPISDRKIF